MIYVVYNQNHVINYYFYSVMILLVGWGFGGVMMKLGVIWISGPHTWNFDCWSFYILLGIFWYCSYRHAEKYACNRRLS